MNITSTSVLSPFLTEEGVMIIDGGLATELERKGYDLRHRLWSARLLIDHPQAIRDVHRAYLEAGADCIITASYQASVPGLRGAGLSEKEARSVLAQSVSIANQARKQFIEARGGKLKYPPPLVAGSIGPYGAYLADGSEYRGKYGLSDAELRAYHLPRWEMVSEMQPDIMACETIPCPRETEVLAKLLSETPGMMAWFSFSCRDGRHLSDGTPVRDVVNLLSDAPGVAAIGVNCTAPRFVDSLIEEIRAENDYLPVAVYPNSGEVYDPLKKQWRGSDDLDGFITAAIGWKQKGARLIGGCCRTTPEHIRRLRQNLTGGPVVRP